MSFAREGFVFILVATLLAAGVFVVALNRRSWPLWLLALALVVVTLGVAYFFRDPERTGDRGATIVVAPADGRVVEVATGDEPTFIGGAATRISIVTNVFDVRVNRYPISGTIRHVLHPAAQGAAAGTSASGPAGAATETSLGIESEIARVLVRQVARGGAGASSLLSSEGQRVEQGDRMGLIRFGSRVDLHLPAGSTVRVRVGETTVAGTTIIGELSTP